MFVKGMVKKSTADVIWLTKFKRVIGMNEWFVQIMKISVSLMEYLLQTQGTFSSFFV